MIFFSPTDIWVTQFLLVCALNKRGGGGSSHSRAGDRSGHSVDV